MESSLATPSPVPPPPPPSPSLPPSQEHSQWQVSLRTPPTHVQLWPVTAMAQDQLHTHPLPHWKTVRLTNVCMYSLMFISYLDSLYQLRLGGEVACSELVSAVYN